jgi:hypothetical protein
MEREKKEERLKRGRERERETVSSEKLVMFAHKL